jgi:hypothetical protein
MLEYVLQINSFSSHTRFISKVPEHRKTVAILNFSRLCHTTFSLHDRIYSVLNYTTHSRKKKFVLHCGSHVRDTADETRLRVFRRRIIQYNCTCGHSTIGDVVVMQLPFHRVRSIVNFYQKNFKSAVILFSPDIKHVYDIKRVSPIPTLTCVKLHIRTISGNVRPLSLQSGFSFQLASLYQ